MREREKVRKRDRKRERKSERDRKRERKRERMRKGEEDWGQRDRVDLSSNVQDLNH